MQVDHHGDGEQAGVKMSNDCIVRIFRITAPCHHITNTDTIAEQIQIQTQLHNKYKYRYKCITNTNTLWGLALYGLSHIMCKIVYVCGTLCIWILYLSVAHNVGPVVFLYIPIFYNSLQLNLWCSCMYQRWYKRDGGIAMGEIWVDQDHRVNKDLRRWHV